jgi:hypothetical protein
MAANVQEGFGQVAARKTSNTSDKNSHGGARPGRSPDTKISDKVE